MTIYKVEQVTFGHGVYGDFSLPRTLGHYKRSAQISIMVDIKAKAKAADKADRTYSEDYLIRHIQVED
jgi:hypothetical protein